MSSRALDLPEILTHIGRFFSNQSLTVAIRVNSTWLTLLRPILWHSLRLSAYSSSKKSIPPVDSIRTHGHLIRDVWIYGKLSPESTLALAKTCARLEIMDCHRPGQDLWKDILDLTTNNSSTLRRIQLCSDSNERASIMSDLWELLLLRAVQEEGQPFDRTQVIKLERIPFNCSPAFVAFWSVCSQAKDLKVLHLKSLWVPSWKNVQACLNLHKERIRQETEEGVRDLLDTDPRTQLQKLHRVKVLAFDRVICQGGAFGELQLAKLCPNLEDLCWKIDDAFIFPVEDFCSAVASRTWPNLAALEVAGGMFKDEHLAGLLTHFAALKKFVVKCSGFGPLSMEAMKLRNHCETVVEMDLHRCKEVTSLMLCQILTSAPCLKTFSADNIHVLDILQGGPWVCRQLEDLVLGIDMTVPAHTTKAEQQQLHRDIYERVADLVHLQVLNLTRHCAEGNREAHHLAGQLANTGSPQPTPPEWRPRQIRHELTFGMGALSTLKKLCFFRFKRGQMIGLEEVNWMRDHWPMLQMISSPLHRDPTVDAELVDILDKQMNVFVL